jgi:hypothetical protein
MKRLRKGDSVRIMKDGSTFRHIVRKPDPQSDDFTEFKAEAFLKFVETQLPPPVPTS